MSNILINKSDVLKRTFIENAN